MANPTLVPCGAGAWTKVATNVTAGMIWIVKNDPRYYLHTYRLTGAAAPTLEAEGLRFPISDGLGGNAGLPIESGTGIDVYIWADTTAGQVRVDV